MVMICKIFLMLTIDLGEEGFVHVDKIWLTPIGVHAVGVDGIIVVISFILRI